MRLIPWSLAALSFALGGGSASLAKQPEPQAAAATAPGMVSSADQRASEAGVEMLRLGGSATDAAIATM